jgi:arylsulfatase A-like enzyme
MKKNQILGSILSLFLCFSAMSQAPKVPIVLVDDLGYVDLSCISGEDIHTSHSYKLFKKGIRFNNFYANSTVCSPTRASLITGRYRDMVGVQGVVRPDQDANWGYW